MKREPGFYWWRQDADERWQVVEVTEVGESWEDSGDLLFTGSDCRARVEGSTGEWGPRLTPPAALAPELF